jgi:hypothetical protein
MSIYATLWTLKFPREGDARSDCEWITVHAQAVPPHIGTPTPGHGYEGGDPYAGFLPPPVAVDAEGAAPYDLNAARNGYRNLHFDTVESMCFALTRIPSIPNLRFAIDGHDVFA